MSEKKNSATNGDIKNIAGYCKRVAQNSYKNECRSNDNAAKHISPTGIWFDGYKSRVMTEADIENIISAKAASDWLLFIENKRLHKGLSSLPPKDLEYIFEFYKNGYTQAQMAESLGVNQSTVNRKLQRILKKLKGYF